MRFFLLRENSIGADNGDADVAGAIIIYELRYEIRMLVFGGRFADKEERCSIGAQLHQAHVYPYSLKLN